MHYLSRREEKKRKERNGKLIICNYWRVSNARYDRWNRSYATKIATIRRYTEGRKKKKKKRASSYLLRQCFQSRNLETFFFATGFTVYVPLSIFRGIFNRGSSSSLIFHDPYRIFIIHDDIGARISSRFPKSQNRFELRLNSREIAAHLSPDRWIAADERLRSRQHRSKLGDFRPPCLQSVFRALSFRPDLSFPPFPKWKVIIVVARRSKISSNDESRENDEIITG